MTQHLRAFRVELDLTVEQKRWCERACAVSRVTYNWGLAEWQRWYRWQKLEDKKKTERARALLTRWAALPARMPVRTTPDFEGKPSAFGVSARLTQEKKRSLAWMHELGNAYVPREAIGALGKAYAAFFRRLKKHRKGDHSECGKSRRGSCSLGAPRFHARRPDEGFVCDEAKRLASGMEGKRAWLSVPGLGRVYAKVGQRLPEASFDGSKGSSLGTPCTCGKPPEKKTHKPGCKGRQGGWVGDGTELCGVGIRRWGGRWYASIRAHAEGRDERPRQAGKRIAVEAGLRYRAVTFDGLKVGAFADTRKSLPSAHKLRKIAEKLGTPEAIEAARKARHTHGTARLEKLEKKRLVWERRQSRRWTAGKSVREQSRGWHEARAKVAKLHRQIAEYRADRIHFVSRMIVNSGASEIVLRDMRVKELLQRGSAEDLRVRGVLADDVQKAGMAELARQLEYKQAWSGGTTTKVSGDKPETKVCWACGAEREKRPGYPWFLCPSCGYEDDRDTNAAKVRFEHQAETPDKDAAE